MNIQIDPKKIKILKKIMEKTEVQEDIERLVNNWIDSTILTYYKNKKSITDALNDLDI